MVKGMRPQTVMTVLPIGIRMPDRGRQAIVIRSGPGSSDSDDEVADEMGSESDSELRWSDSGDLSSAAKTP